MIGITKLHHVESGGAEVAHHFFRHSTRPQPLRRSTAIRPRPARAPARAGAARVPAFALCFAASLLPAAFSLEFGSSREARPAEEFSRSSPGLPEP